MLGKLSFVTLLMGKYFFFVCLCFVLIYFLMNSILSSQDEIMLINSNVSCSEIYTSGIFVAVYVGFSFYGLALPVCSSALWLHYLKSM